MPCHVVKARTSFRYLNVQVLHHQLMPLRYALQLAPRGREAEGSGGEEGWQVNITERCTWFMCWFALFAVLICAPFRMALQQGLHLTARQLREAVGIPESPVSVATACCAS